MAYSPLQHYIAQVIRSSGKISFKDYMELVLYTPDLGYYDSPNFFIGKDFITAPHISPLFSHCLARQCLQLMEEQNITTIVEWGAGSGLMACHILEYLNTQGCIPQQYYIIEKSAQLRKKQQQLLQEKIPHLFSNVQWVDTVPTHTAIILANEFLDALPVHRLHVQDQKIQEYYVQCEQEQFFFVLDEPSSTQIKNYGEQIRQSYLGALNNYSFEINPHIHSFLQAVTEKLERGLILLLDYGYPAPELYHPERSLGSLQCFSQHTTHPELLKNFGTQDITAHVNFTAVLESALQLGLQLGGYTSQGLFLINCGIGDLWASSLQNNAALKRLTMPQEMGEIVKALALTKGFETDLMGFKHNRNQALLSTLI